MGRYSELFSKLPSHPDRFDSLQTLKEDDVPQEPMPRPTITTAYLSSTARPRRGTEPSPSETLPQWSPFHEPAASSSAEHLPHIFQLASRPKPLQRHNTAPIALSALNCEDPQLSTASKVNQGGMSDPETASVSSSATSPTTPTWQESTLIESYISKASCETSMSCKSTNNSTDIITVPYKSSVIETGVVVSSRTQQSDDDWKDSKPQVAIARSLSVTKAGSRAGLRPTRVNSKKRTVVHDRTKANQTVVPPSVPEKVASPDSGPEATTTQQPSRPAFIRAPSRKEELQRDLTREIWGQHGNFVTQRQMQEKKMLVPNLCVIQDGEARKSVYAVMECDEL